MVYRADGQSLGSTVWVGWLDESKPFPTGATDPVFLQRLLRLCRQRTAQTRGYHLCPFCPDAEMGFPIEVEGELIKLGSAEIHVKAADGRTFAAPDLICHYFAAHGYRPPEEFIEAVCAM